jgi:tRNA(Ile)-lysidine synthase
MRACKRTVVSATPRSVDAGAAPAACVAVAYSGGRDSTALLHATLTIAAERDLRVLALHVHHGLSSLADVWLNHCEAQCRRWSDDGLPVQFFSHRITTQPASGESVEAWARAQRYAALQAMAGAEGADLVLLAHHQQDQAETFLLQALRGAGVAGQAGMPGQVLRADITWARPWLGRTRADIEAYVAAHNLAWVEDTSNADPRYGRNRLRNSLWPELTASFPQAERMLAVAAKWAQEAQSCMQDLARIDVGEIAPDGKALLIKSWLRLSEHRRRSALREWLLQQSGEMPKVHLTQRLMDELAFAGPAHWQLPQGRLHRYRGELSFSRTQVPSELPPPPRESDLVIDRAGEFVLPGWGGVLTVQPVERQGLCAALPCRLLLRPRHAGASFQMGSGRVPRSLKKQYQAAGVPEWSRVGPLMYRGPELVLVPGLGIDARVWAAHGEPQWGLTWRVL